MYADRSRPSDSRRRRSEPSSIGQPISSITPSPKDPSQLVIRCGRRRVGLIDQARAASLGIGLGVLLTDELAAALAQAETDAKARAYALRALARRPLSRAALIAKLRARHCSADAAKQIADDLTHRGLLNDAALADSVVSSELARKPAGKALLLNRLRARGVDSAAARKAVDDATTADDYNPLEGAIAVARKRLRVMPQKAAPDAVRRRLYGALARRGFDPDTCRRAVEAVTRPERGND